MPDINALWQQAQGMSIPQLEQAIAGQFPTMPAAVAAPALIGKKQLMDAARLQQGGNPPTSTVMEDLQREFSGIGALPPGTLAPQPQLFQQAPQPQPGQQMLQPGQQMLQPLTQGAQQPMAQQQPPQPMQQPMKPQGYAGGGIVSLANGETVPEPDSYPAWLGNTLFGRQGYDLSNIPSAMYDRSREPTVNPTWQQSLDPSFDPLRPTTSPAAVTPSLYTGEPEERISGPTSLGAGGANVVVPPPPNPDDTYKRPIVRTGGVGLKMPESTANTPDIQAIMNQVTEAMKNAPGTADLAKAGVQANRPLADIKRETDALMPSGQPYETSMAELKKMQGELADQRGSRLGQALMQAGFATMAGTSPYAMTNIGAGAGAGMRQYLETQKADDDTKMKLTTLAATYEQAQRAEAVGNVDRAMTQQRHLQDQFAKLTSDQKQMWAQGIGHAISGQFGLAEGRERNAATIAAANIHAATSANDTQARLDSDYQLMKLKLGQEEKNKLYGAIGVHVAEGRKTLMNILTRPDSAATPLGQKLGSLSDEEREAYIYREARNSAITQMKLEEMIRKGLGSMPKEDTTPAPIGAYTYTRAGGYQPGKP
jgi:hypothetical protein